MTKRQEILDFKLRAYRTINLGDDRYQNWRTASTVFLELVAEIDGIEIPIAAQTLSHDSWERYIKAYGKSKPEQSPA